VLPLQPLGIESVEMSAASGDPIAELCEICCNDVRSDSAMAIPIILSAHKVLRNDVAVCHKRVLRRCLSSATTPDPISSTNISFMLRIMHLNPTSLAKPDAIPQLQAEIYKFNPDLVLISETFFKARHIAALVNIHSYSLFRRDRD